MIPSTLCVYTVVNELNKCVGFLFVCLSINLNVHSTHADQSHACHSLIFSVGQSERNVTMP